jgi:hypothetical protein
MPATYQGYSQQQWARLFNTTLAKHRRTMEENTLRNYQMGALLEANGRVSYNHGGNGFDWPVAFKRGSVTGNTGEQTRNFVRKNRYKVANLDYRGYEATDSMTWAEFLANKGEEGIVKIFDTMVSNLETDMRQHFGRQYFVDGNATGNETCWHGFESMFGTNTSLDTIAIDGSGARSANQADIVANPSDTYAGISTVLGTYGGEQESSVPWPHGQASAEYDFWSPLVIVFDSTAFSATDDTFDKGDEAIRYGLTHANRNMGGKDEAITQVVLDRELFRTFKKIQGAKEEIVVDNASQGSLRSLGFRNTFIFDGVEITPENGVPNRVGYGFNINGIELVSMDETLLKTESEWKMETQSYNAVVSTLSNLVFRTGPRNTFKLVEYDTISA